MARRQNQQTISWFWDLHQRDRLDLDPSYQRRSVWNQSYRDFFIDTLLLEYPAPAIFLYEDLSPDGNAVFRVVDGKQRLTAIFDFASNVFPVSEQSKMQSLRGLYFKDLDDNVKLKFWQYEFSVEYLPTNNDAVIGEIFDRINRNTAKLTPQELRHAKYSGVFISKTEELALWMESQLPPGMPNLATQSRKQMKDVELVAQLLLALEVGPRGYSTAQLDEAFSSRDEEWEGSSDLEARFRQTVQFLASLFGSEAGIALLKTRLRNQADFYSLFVTVDDLVRAESLPGFNEASVKLLDFIETVEDEGKRRKSKPALSYYEAARSASNDTAQRAERSELLKKLLSA